MRLPLHQVDAFASEIFRGNPAAVCPLEAWLPDETMQAIAMENNLSETAFFVREGDAHRIRWFTPVSEVPLCGHATLASAWVLFHALGAPGDEVRLVSKSGPLSVRRRGELLVLDFPVLPLDRCSAPFGANGAAIDAIGSPPVEVHGREGLLFAVYGDEAQVRALTPDFPVLARADLRVIVTAPGSDVDFVSRFFAPSEGIDEDPVTGSAHCTLIPYWAERLGKTTLRARQVSRRGGELECALVGDRVHIGGRAVRYLEGTITIP
ncbi:MAG: PhzF family phenazine biosynthesis protein [Deltaproteobacteria bacterium]|nr:PhzF family phenazine biosynthesis protein [Deltaproteobacteria bacterium]